MKKDHAWLALIVQFPPQKGGPRSYCMVDDGTKTWGEQGLPWQISSNLYGKPTTLARVDEITGVKYWAVLKGDVDAGELESTQHSSAVTGDLFDQSRES